MDEATHPQTSDEPPHEALVDALVVDEMGDTIAEVVRLARRAQEAWHRREHPEEGLRERKRRLTRQLISDAATAMFAARGFDHVTVSEVADRVGVSEKTIYNYFPTKESMVLDTTDESVRRLTAALRERRPGESITEAIVGAIKADSARFDGLPDELARLVPLFAEMIDTTPALRAAALEVHDRFARVIREELAAQAGVDPADPEPTAAGRALVGLIDVAMGSRVRHTAAGLRGAALRDAVADDLDRAARLLETGLWSLHLPRSRRATTQAIEAARAAEEARVQVLRALREARAAWDQARRRTDAIRDARGPRGRPPS